MTFQLLLIRNKVCCLSRVVKKTDCESRVVNITVEVTELDRGRGSNPTVG